MKKKLPSDSLNNKDIHCERRFSVLTRSEQKDEKNKQKKNSIKVKANVRSVLREERITVAIRIHFFFFISLEIFSGK